MFNRILYTILLLGNFFLNAQDSLSLQFIVDGTIEKELGFYSNELTLNEQINQRIDNLHQQHFLGANLDSISKSEILTKVFLSKGEQYNNIIIEPNALAKEYGNSRLNKRKYKYREALKIKNELLQNAENNGYPFAEIYFDSILVRTDSVSAKMNLQLNQYIEFDEIKIIGNSKISQNFIGPYLGLGKGKAFSRKELNKAMNRINNLPFLTSTKNPNLVFNKEGADIYIFANDKNASRFDALIGLLPVNDPLIDQTVILTATALLDLQNTLNRGERIFLEFRQLKPLTQNVNAEFSYPYVFNLPFGLRSSFEFSKQDTTFLDIDYSIGAQYLFEGGNFVEFFFSSDVSRLLDINEELVILNKTLPSKIDTRTQYYGVQVRYNNLDKILNPRIGWEIKSKFMVGQKKLIRNNLVLELEDPNDPSFEFASLYTQNEPSDQYVFNLDIARYFSLGGNSVLKTTINSAAILGKSKVFENEQFRIGGNRLLRGFNEQTFFTDRYLVNTLEYRFLLSDNSALIAFSDISILQFDKELKEYNHPWGLGLGISFQTNTGLLSLSAAVGKDLSNDQDFFDLAKPKIHVGYFSIF